MEIELFFLQTCYRYIVDIEEKYRRVVFAHQSMWALFVFLETKNSKLTKKPSLSLLLCQFHEYTGFPPLNVFELEATQKHKKIQRFNIEIFQTKKCT